MNEAAIFALRSPIPLDFFRNYVFCFLGRKKSMKNRSVHKRYMRILNLFLTNPGSKRQWFRKRSNRKLRYFSPRFQLVLSTINPTLLIFFNLKNTAIIRSISNGFICISFKKRLILRSCDAPFTEASNDGIKRLRLTVRNVIIPFIIIIKHLALDLFSDMCSRTHWASFWIFIQAC